MDYGAGIKAFMDQFIGCPIDEKSQEIIDRIINSEGGKAVIHYIAVYRKKTGDDVKEEKIETQYREFLKEFDLLLGRWKMHVWMKKRKITVYESLPF
mgnify:CR=1 FL=1